MFQRVLVAVDGSPHALAAARVAARLARDHRGRLHACYVVDRSLLAAPAATVVLRDPVRQDLEAHGRRVLGRVERLCRALGVPCRVAVLEGAVGPVIVAEALRVRARLIVMGTEGPGRLKAFLLGSRSRDVVSDAPCPVLLVPPGAARASRSGKASPRSTS